MTAWPCVSPTVWLAASVEHFVTTAASVCGTFQQQPDPLSSYWLAASVEYAVVAATDVQNS
jgi:hypothetical protein